MHNKTNINNELRANHRSPASSQASLKIVKSSGRKTDLFKELTSSSEDVSQHLPSGKSRKFMPSKTKNPESEPNKTGKRF